MFAEEFLEIIIQTSSKKDSSCQSSILLKILSDIPKEVDITKKQAAIIAHEYIKKILHIEDEDDITAANQLRDLYDCRVCAHHIAQVYCKGIMGAMIDATAAGTHELPMLFGVNEPLSEAEASTIAERISFLYENVKKDDLTVGINR